MPSRGWKRGAENSRGPDLHALFERSTDRMSFLRHLRAWRHILRVPSARKMSRYFHETMRYYTLKALEREGLFEYLKQPRTYGEIVAHFDYVDGEYTRELFDTLVSDDR